MPKPCYVKTGTEELTTTVIEMAKRAGFDRPHTVSRTRSGESGVSFGPWEDEGTYNHPGFYWVSNYDWNLVGWRNTAYSRKHWPDFDASTEAGMNALKAYWFPEDVFDETPLPHFTMTKEQEKETKSRFNMSDDQWEALPLNAKKALCGENVQIVEAMPYKWIPIGVVTRAVTNCDSVVFSDCGAKALGNADSLAFGFFDGHDDGTYTPNVRFHGGDFDGPPTHYAILPSEELAPGEEPAQCKEWRNQDDEEEEDDNND